MENDKPESTNIEKTLIDAGVLPPEMPSGFTFDKVRALLEEMAPYSPDQIRSAIDALFRLGIKGPLAAMIFLAHHLAGEHKVEVDRIAASEDGVKYAVLSYREGEVPVSINGLPEEIAAGAQLIYDPASGQYKVASEK